jgi:ParB family chromosome partitioning protein
MTEKIAKSFKAMAANGSVKKSDLWRVDPRKIEEEEGFNLRDYNDPDVVAHIRALADSYKAGAFVPPLVLRTDDNGRILAVEGHCRRRGALLAISEGADLPFVDAVAFRGGDTERVEVMLRSAEGLKLKPLSVADGYARLTRAGYSNADIARKMNKTPSHVEQMLLLAYANSDVRSLIKDGLVSATLAIETLRDKGEGAGAFLMAALEQKSEGQAKDSTASGAKKRLTAATLRGWAPPRKLAVEVVSVVEDLLGTVDSLSLEWLDSALERNEDVSGKTVAVDAGLLAKLLKAQQQIAAKRDKSKGEGGDAQPEQVSEKEAA